MDSEQSSEASLRTRRRQANRNESDDENGDTEQSRSPASPHSPPRRRARMNGDDNDLESNNSVSTYVDTDVVDSDLANQSSRITAPSEGEHEHENTPSGNESVDDQPSTSARPRVSVVSRRHRIVLREASPLLSDDEMVPAREAESSNVAVNGQPSSSDSEEASIRHNSYAETLRRRLLVRELVETSNVTSDQPSTSAQLVDSGSPTRDVLRRGRQDLAANQTSESTSDRLPWEEQARLLLARTTSNPFRRNRLPNQQVSQQVELSLAPEMAIPQEVLDFFGPEGLKDDDNEEVADIEEMAFQKILKKKMVCDICMVHMKQFRCFKCFYSMCKECSDTLRGQHTGKVPCPQCRTKQQKFLPIILPRL